MEGVRPLLFAVPALIGGAIVFTIVAFKKWSEVMTRLLYNIRRNPCRFLLHLFSLPIVFGFRLPDWIIYIEILLALVDLFILMHPDGTRHRGATIWVVLSALHLCPPAFHAAESGPPGGAMKGIMLRAALVLAFADTLLAPPEVASEPILAAPAYKTRRPRHKNAPSSTRKDTPRQEIAGAQPTVVPPLSIPIAAATPPITPRDPGSLTNRQRKRLNQPRWRHGRPLVDATRATLKSSRSAARAATLGESRDRLSGASQALHASIMAAFDRCQGPRRTGRSKIAVRDGLAASIAAFEAAHRAKLQRTASKASAALRRKLEHHCRAMQDVLRERAREALRAKEQERAAELRRMQDARAHARALEVAREEEARFEAEREAIRQRHAAELQEHEDALTARHRDELQAQEKRHTDELYARSQAAKEEHAAALKQQEDAAAARHADELAAQERSLKEQHAATKGSELQTAQSEHGRAVQALNEQHAAARQALEERHAADLKRAREEAGAEHATELAALRAQHKDVLLQTQRVHEDELERVQRDHDAITADLEQQIAELRSELSTVRDSDHDCDPERDPEGSPEPRGSPTRSFVSSPRTPRGDPDDSFSSGESPLPSPQTPMHRAHPLVPRLTLTPEQQHVRLQRMESDVRGQSARDLEVLDQRHQDRLASAMQELQALTHRSVSIASPHLQRSARVEEPDAQDEAHAVEEDTQRERCDAEETRAPAEAAPGSPVAEGDAPVEAGEVKGEAPKEMPRISLGVHMQVIADKERQFQDKLEALKQSHEAREDEIIEEQTYYDAILTAEASPAMNRSAAPPDTSVCPSPAGTPKANRTHEVTDTPERPE